MQQRIRPGYLNPAAIAGGVLAVGAGGLYLAGTLINGDGIDPGTRIRGVDVGGLSRAEAEQKLQRELVAGEGAQPLAVRIGDREDTIDPAAAGLSVDTEATVDRAARGGADPVTVIGGLFRSGGDVEPVVHLDERKARAALQDLAEEHDQQVRDGAVAFKDGKPEARQARTGHTLDVDGAVTALRSAYLPEKPAARTDRTQLPTHDTEPKVTAAETGRALREFAEPAMSGPVTLDVGGGELTIGPDTLGEHLDLKADASGRLEPHLDSAGLIKDPEVAKPLARLTGAAKNAELGLDGDRVVVASDGRPGRTVTDKALGKAVLPLLTRTGAAARTGEVATRTTQPQITRESAAELGLTEKMSSFTVDFERAAYRTKNIGRAVELINGSLVKPGQEWSFNRTVGERTKANGFVDGTIILNGMYTKAAGGGVSTVATTMYNALFFAGVKPLEYGAHSFYIERYPAGREATVAWGSLDLRFLNDSGNAIYIKAESTDTSVTVTFLGTKKYDEVLATQGERENITQPKERTNTSEQCEPQTPLEGFDITVERILKDDGREVKREPYRTHYTPRDKVTCEPEATAEPTPGDEPTPGGEPTPGDEQQAAAGERPGPGE
ncbi:VanW family protein [Streptomyces sp. B-S-A8]|uniref:VanW family protein n=1 Tax=Streptomyces solicavernae TaxID=3043614 RepID=A0ABT6RMI2_9ACTN|nr:VanW family protein [Streptomyces sp. B-S-A8]MDI3385515.1 VanW family protein [Streptomyces sp. B-S-A8]